MSVSTAKKECGSPLYDTSEGMRKVIYYRKREPAAVLTVLDVIILAILEVGETGCWEGHQGAGNKKQAYSAEDGDPAFPKGAGSERLPNTSPSPRQPRYPFQTAESGLLRSRIIR